MTKSKGIKAPRWTEADDEALRSACDPRFPVCLADVAKRLGRTRGAVAARSSRLGIADASRPKRIGPAKPTRKFDTPEQARAARADAARARIAAHGHPRGALGMKHTPEAKAAISSAGKASWANPKSRFNAEDFRQRMSDVTLGRALAGEFGRSTNAFSRAKKGTREDLGLFFRSRWEANYARFLNLLVRQGKVASWAYEVRTFVFEAIKRGTRSYTPDFRVEYPGGRVEWHEVKGYLDQKGRTRIERFQKYFPEEKLVVIGEAWFKSAARSGLAGAIPHWEAGK